MPKHLKITFDAQVDEEERLTFTSLEANREGETLIAQLQRRKGYKWETVGTMILLRQQDVTYRQLTESK